MASYSSAAAVDYSESTLSTETVTGFHILKINRYSKTVGESIKSSVFTVGGHRWQIQFFPHGYNEEGDDFVSFDLVLNLPKGDKDTVVKAKFWLTLLDQAGEPVPGYAAAMGLCVFSGEVPSYGCERFIVREDLEAAPHVVNDDSFSIRCDVTVFPESRAVEEAFAPSQITTKPPPRTRALVSARLLFFLMSMLVAYAAYYWVTLMC